MIIDIRQSDQFASFMIDIGWQTLNIGHNKVYTRKIPLMGTFAKMPRPTISFTAQRIAQFQKNNNISRMKIAPNLILPDPSHDDLMRNLTDIGFKVDSNPFNPTTTIQINLQQFEQDLFNNFVEAKRRAVRRAVKNHLRVEESADFNSFIRIRQQQYFPLGFLVTSEMNKLWKNFFPQNASLLLAYQNMMSSHPPLNSAITKKSGERPLAGILLLFYKKVAYYWFASSLKEGKKLFAPTLLVYEALKVAKKRGCLLFDFEGIYDPRFPKAAESWKGFTKFKEGFGGKKIILCENLTT